MMKLKKVLGTALLAGVLAAPGWAQTEVNGLEVKKLEVAHGGLEVAPIYNARPHFGSDGFVRMADQFDQLELADDQRAQLEANRVAIRESRIAHRKQAGELRHQLHKAIKNGADQSALDDIGAQLGYLEVAHAQTMSLLRREFQAVLTDEQKLKLKQLKAEAKARYKFYGKRMLDIEPVSVEYLPL